MIYQQKKEKIQVFFSAVAAASIMDELIEKLNLKKFSEGVYHGDSFQSERWIQTEDGKKRQMMSAIYYLLQKDVPIDSFIENESTVMHFFHAGDPMIFYLVHPDGRLETKILGQDLDKGQEFLFTATGGVWKCSTLGADSKAGYSLISEVVVPGFNQEDFKSNNKEEIIKRFPQHKDFFDNIMK